MSTRANKLAQAAIDAGVDAVLITNHHDLRWLTGFTGSNGAALVGAEGLQVFLTDFRYVEQASVEVSEDWNHVDGGRDLLGAALSDQLAGAKRLGFDDTQTTVATLRRLTVAAGEGVELVPLSSPVLGLRQTKDAGEQEAISQASALAQEAFVEVVLEGKVVGKTERELALELEQAMRLKGAQRLSFDSIVAFGAHGALPHAQPRDVAIEPGYLLTVDWGCELDGYCSDCTRTVATGSVGQSANHVYETVLEAQKQSLAAVKAGADSVAVDKVARDLISAAGFGEFFGHGLGHGVGLEVHEQPVLSPRGSGKLAVGEVVTVEPGIYLPGQLGVRIEDLVVVTEQGSRVLTDLSKELVEVS